MPPSACAVARTAQASTRPSGSLTARLAEHAGAVCTVEVDKTLQPVAKQIVGDRANVRFVFGDALARKNELNPEMLRAWEETAAAHGCTRRKLVANLPLWVLLGAAFTVFQRSLSTRFGIGARAKALGRLAAQLDSHWSF